MKPRYALVKFVQSYNKIMSEHAGFFRPFLAHYTEMLSCPDPLLLEAYGLQSLDSEQLAFVQAHLQTCSHCVAKLQALEQSAHWVLPDLSESTLPAPAQPAADAPPESLPDLQPGQIWSTLAELKLSAHALGPADCPSVQASLLRLFVVVALGPLHLGRYREVQVCPLSEWTELASAQDLILGPTDQPFEETVMLECWNQSPALALHLEAYLGQISTQALADLQAMLQHTEHGGLRGGQLISEQGAHAEFQRLEREQIAYLQQPLAAVKSLQQTAQKLFLHISPQGLSLPAAQPQPAHPRFAVHQPSDTLPTLAAASSSTTQTDTPQARKHRLSLSAELQLEVWLAGPNLEFYCTSLEQEPVRGLQIGVPDLQGGILALETDALGTAFVPLSTLPAALVLIELSLPSQQLQSFLPVFHAET